MYGVIWAHLAGGKESLQPDDDVAVDVLAGLLGAADILVVDGTSQYEGILPAVRPEHLVEVDLSPFGRSGPYSGWRGSDIATWAIGQDKMGMGPVEIDGTDAKHPVPYKGGYTTVTDCYNTSHDYAVNCKFANGIEMIVTSRGDNGILFEGSKGRIFVSRGKITGTPIEQKWDDGKFDASDLTRLYKDKPAEGHKNNFYRCIREGGLTVSDVFSHVQAMNTCHLSAIAARLGRAIKWDPKAEQIVGDDQAAAFFARTPRKGFEIPVV